MLIGQGEWVSWMRHISMPVPVLESSSCCGRLIRSRLKYRRSFLCIRTMSSIAAAKGKMETADLPKNFDFTTEERMYNWWESEGYFKPNMNQKEHPFVISMPPPNVTGNLHMGHAMFVTLEDIMIRHWRMRGRPALWIPGTDHAGIATQLVVEKMLNAKGIRRTDIGRDAFVEKVWEWKKKYGNTITSQLRILGASCDWTRERFTLDDRLSKAVVRAFVHLHKKGLIYRGSYMVNWSPNLQTAVSDLEVEYTEEPGTLYYFKYPLAGGTSDDFIPVATTRPETLLGDTAVAVHPEDTRYSLYIGKNVVVPMSGREIPVVADEYVDKDFGTGALKITPGHDHNDYEIAQRLNLPIINILNKDATLNDAAGPYSGLDRFAARKKLWSDMEAASLVIKTEPYTLRVPRSQRGGEVIEPIVSKQWFVTMAPLAKQGLHAVDEGALRIIPARFEKTYVQWLTNIKDWCISRQLWWGHRLPVWYVKDGKEDEDYIVAENEEEALIKAREKYGEDVHLEQDLDVLDTWFSSGLWPFSTLGWPEESAADLKKFYPTSVLETGHDILFFWVARMVMMGIELTGKPPFSTVYLHGLVRDSKGRKMSKTLGNVIDPREIVKEYGTDALRFTLATGTAAGQDLNLSMERLGANKAFTNKLWNAGKFIIQNASSNSAEQLEFKTESELHRLPLCERWVVTKVHMLINAVTSNYENFEFGEAGRVIYDFFWSEFADWYIEASKTRLYKKDNTSNAVMAQIVLVHVFNNILKLLHPFMPFVTEQLWQAMPQAEGALIAAEWPEINLPKDLSSLPVFEELQALVKAIRNARAEYSVEPGRRITAAIVTREPMLSTLEGEIDVLVTLCKLDEATVQIRPDTPEEVNKAVHLVVSEGLEAYLPLADMIDVGKEMERLSKQMTRLESEYKSSMNRISSSEFLDKAPAAVVETMRQKANDAKEKLQVLERRLDFLKNVDVAQVTR